MIHRSLMFLAGFSCWCAGVSANAQGDTLAGTAESIIQATGVRAGLVVQLGCDDGQLAADLGRSGTCVVHVLDHDATRVARARQHIRSQNLYGRVSAETWNAPFLPHVDNSANLVVGLSPDMTSQAEIMRVLVPQGVAYLKEGDSWKKIVKPPREGVDEWTHFLHDATGNPVAHDRVVGPPRHLQWTAGPRHSRSHEYTPSIQAVVSAQGRVFYIADQGAIETLKAPADWHLIARDAYNGVLLWERSVGQWFTHIFGWTRGPRQLQRKLVAVGKDVFVAPGFHAPLMQLDAATGQTVRVFPNTEGTEEILCHDGVLLIVVRAVSPQREAAYKKWHELVAQADSPLHLRDSRTPLANAFREVERQSPLSVLAFDTATGKQLWGLSAAQSQGLKPLSLRACGGRAFCEKRGQLHCLDLRSGETLWTKSSDAMRALSEDALVCVSKRQVTLRSPADGEVRWKQPVSLATIRDVLLVGDSLWMGGGRPHDTGNSRHTGPAWGAYFAVQRDLKSGKILQEITAENPKHHHRCYENKATDRYILGGRRGTEFLDLESGEYLWHSWARGTCRYGVMPCNGMVYIPPHACGCYITVKLMGFNALAPADQQPRDTGNWDADARLARGPAFAESTAVTADSGSVDWPTFLGDTERSGRAAGNLPPVLTQRWQQELQGPITPATASGGQLYVARPEQHEVVALQAQDGQQVWAFTAGGRVDSPPTIHQGQVIFGCRDGYVYNLRARDGTLNWRYRAATQPRRVVADGQVESAAAIHGSVLIDEGMLVFTAGRSSYLDGGLELFRLDPQTGETLSKSTLYSPDPKTGQQPQQYGPNSMPGARSDILAADDQHLYLRDLTFDKLGNEIDQPQSHLFTLTDYLDDSCAHRSYWIFGTKPSISTGCSGRDRQLLYGRVLVFDDSTVYGYGRESVHWSNEFEDGRYRLFARHRDAQKPDWSVSTPVHIRAMLLAGDRILAAGSGTAPGKYTPVTSRKATPMLLVYSAVDGAEMARYALPSPPVQNGLAAADGCLYLALADGTLLCHGP